MSVRTYYTHKQARVMLRGIDAKTLNKWLEEAGIVMQPDPRDRRYKRMTRTQLQRLATLHGIALPDEEALREQATQGKSLAALTLEVERLQQAVDELTDSIPMQLGELRAAVLEEVRRLLRHEMTSQQSPSLTQKQEENGN